MANRPALKELFEDIKAGQIDMVVVYKIDRLSRSLFDFSRIVELLEKHNVGFVSVTQAFNTSTSSGKLMLNMLLSFAQYERELTGERIRDKFASSLKKGMWMGGNPPLGYDVKNRALIINDEETKVIKFIYSKFIETESYFFVTDLLNKNGYKTKIRHLSNGGITGGRKISTKRCFAYSEKSVLQRLCHAQGASLSRATRGDYSGRGVESGARNFQKTW